ncbi:MAG: ATP phosphoribosyltransferase regulatory subunit [Oscillospiraceae bacterium]|nr:ATP phosphoribosyltransferase regulatory subunit [Oscillospiraceae bacterium]
MKMLDYQERIRFALREIYDRCGYRPYKMNKFEEYDLYARNKDFLISDSVITFTDNGGKLMALKPDVTLSIVKNTAGTEGLQKLYYNENVYRVSKGSGAFREMMQVGLECLGDIDDYCLTEVILLAARSLLAISEDAVLDISHLGLVQELLNQAGVSEELQPEIFKAVGEKNLHELSAICQRASIREDQIHLLQQVFRLGGSISQVLPRLRELVTGEAVDQFTRILEVLDNTDAAKVLRIDFSVVDNVHYYNGFVFKGFIQGVPSRVLTGGQYDNLMRKMRRNCGAIGFAVYTDELERLGESAGEYDVDTVLLYPENAPALEVFRKTEELMARGIQVLALSRLPEQLRYKNLVRLEGDDLA